MACKAAAAAGRTWIHHGCQRCHDGLRGVGEPGTGIEQKGEESKAEQARVQGATHAAGLLLLTHAPPPAGTFHGTAANSHASPSDDEPANQGRVVQLAARAHGEGRHKGGNMTGWGLATPCGMRPGPSQKSEISPGSPLTSACRFDHAPTVHTMPAAPVGPCMHHPLCRLAAHRKLFRPLVSTTSATPSPGMMAANCTGVLRVKCTLRSRPAWGVEMLSSKPPSDLQHQHAGGRAAVAAAGSAALLPVERQVRCASKFAHSAAKRTSRHRGRAPAGGASGEPSYRRATSYTQRPPAKLGPGFTHRSRVTTGSEDAAGRAWRPASRDAIVALCG